MDLPEKYASADETLKKTIQTQLGLEARYPDSPVPQEALGRIERHLGMAGWQTRLTTSAERYEKWFRKDPVQPNVSTLLLAANLYRLAGQPERATALANEALGIILPPETYGAGPNPFLAQKCSALTILGEWEKLAVCVDTYTPHHLGTTWLVFTSATKALLARDQAAFETAFRRFRKRQEVNWVGSTGMAPSHRDLLEILQEWEPRVF